LLAVLLDDAGAVRVLAEDPTQDLERKISILAAYTCCTGVTALHICAEFNSVECAKALLDLGVNVNASADVDKNGLGGQTPIFHAVNNNHGHFNRNYCRPVMELLANKGAVLDIRLKGLVWGEGMPWETAVFDVTPISYAQCGLYRQFHRPEADVYENLRILYRKRFGVDPPLRNVPNKYLQQ
jgi:ankyrin repeat protein